MTDNMNVYHLPTGKNIPERVLKTLFKTHYNEPPEYPTLAHKIMVPLGWQKINELQSIQIDEINLFEAKVFASKTFASKPLISWQAKGNYSIYPSIQVYATKLTQEISAHNWLRYYVAKSGQQILNLETESVVFADSLVKSQTTEHVVIKRIVAIINGPWLLIVLALAQKSDYLVLAETFGAIVSSFHLLNSRLSDSIESWNNYQLGKRIYFYCPASWQTKLSTETKIELYHDNNALLKVALYSKLEFDKQEKVIENILDEFPEISILDVLHSAPLLQNSLVDTNNHMLIYKIDFKDQIYELWISCFESYINYTVASLVTSSRDSNFYQWAINKRAYGILLQSMLKTR